MNYSYLCLPICEYDKHRFSQTRKAKTASGILLPCFALHMMVMYFCQAILKTISRDDYPSGKGHQEGGAQTGNKR